MLLGGIGLLRGIGYKRRRPQVAGASRRCGRARRDRTGRVARALARFLSFPRYRYQRQRGRRRRSSLSPSLLLFLLLSLPRFPTTAHYDFPTRCASRHDADSRTEYLRAVHTKSLLPLLLFFSFNVQGGLLVLVSIFVLRARTRGHQLLRVCITYSPVRMEPASRLSTAIGNRWLPYTTRQQLVRCVPEKGVAVPRRASNLHAISFLTPDA